MEKEINLNCFHALLVPLRVVTRRHWSLESGMRIGGLSDLLFPHNRGVHAHFVIGQMARISQWHQNTIRRRSRYCQFDCSATNPILWFRSAMLSLQSCFSRKGCKQQNPPFLTRCEIDQFVLCKCRVHHAKILTPGRKLRVPRTILVVKRGMMSNDEPIRLVVMVWSEVRS